MVLTPSAWHIGVGVGVGVGVVLAASLASWLLHRPSSSSKATDSPARLPVILPSTRPVVGNLLDLIRHQAERHDWFARLGERYGGRPFQFRIPGRPPLTVIYTPEMVEEVLKTHFEHAPKGPVQQSHLRDLLGHGIFAVDGAEWVHQRKTASTLFTTRALRDTMTETVGECTTQLVRILQHASERCADVDLFQLLNRFTLQTFAKLAFGLKMDCLDATDGQDRAFEQAFDSAQRILVLRLQRPPWFWKAQRLLNVGIEAQLKKDVAVINHTVNVIVEQALSQRQAHHGQSKDAAASDDLVTLFLDGHGRSKDRRELDPVNIRDIIVNFMIAGRDTTAQAMSWCLYNLTSHPEVVAKIREELRQHIPKMTSGQRTEAPTMEEVQQLVYLDATLKETLRLHPSVPLIPKSVAQDIVLADGTLLRAKTVLTISTYAMGRMESVWGPDAKQFKPERWIDPTTGKPIAVSAFKFAAFNAGPRQCLGMNLAMLEMKIVLATLLARFDLQLVPGQQITYENSLTLPMKDGMRARVVAV